MSASARLFIYGRVSADRAQSLSWRHAAVGLEEMALGDNIPPPPTCAVAFTSMAIACSPHRTTHPRQIDGPIRSLAKIKFPLNSEQTFFHGACRKQALATFNHMEKFAMEANGLKRHARRAI
jgi:hypothetical protein